ncbi:RNA polymerase sigma factor (sigma-70 family) [Actinomadura rupiterrae]|nr:RNA polymerase sigma factor (sigma-70 family) [Actinomadura rupiterrae]
MERCAPRARGPAADEPARSARGLPDADLVAAARAGDAGASAELFARHHRAVLAYAYGLVHDEHTAQDLTSEAFARTLAALRSGGGPVTGLRPYLYAVVRNAAVDWARKARRTVVTDKVGTWADESPGADAASAGGIADAAERVTVVRAFRSLPHRWQVVLWHTVIEDEGVREVAGTLGLKPGAVTQLSFRAREGLRRAYRAASAPDDPSAPSA